MSEEGIFARIPLEDVKLNEAADLVDDPGWFEKTRVPVLFHFPQIGFDGYWDLTVGEHRKLVDFLVASGLLSGDT